MNQKEPMRLGNKWGLKLTCGEWTKIVYFNDCPTQEQIKEELDKFHENGKELEAYGD